ncbi:hypothetical protein Pan3_30 [Pseudanabaena phage Pan3]|nr:hypothetical protein Pan3_30 [Pseudanabaena phage Pan3]
MTWRDIETAPRDGTRVTVGSTDGWVVGDAYWCEEDESWRELNNHPTDVWGWPIEPTHWQPLPPPPEEGL